MKRMVLSVIFIGVALYSLSQPYFNHWTRIAIQHNINTKWTAEHEFQFRYGIENQRYKTVLFSYRGWLTWKPNSNHQLQFSPLAFFSHPKINKTWNRNVEWRLSVWDEVNLKKENWSWLNRFGVEARIWSGNPFRVRYRSGVKWKTESVGNWSLTDEILMGWGRDPIQLQNRLALQWDYSIFEKHKIQLGLQCIHEKQECHRVLLYSGLVFML